MEPMLVLVCGLPGAGKSKLVAGLVAARDAKYHMCECITFDDLFKQWRGPDSDGEFDPIQWKQCQGEMITRVHARLAQWQQQHTAAGPSSKQLVLLVDDNFPYRSQRKRFAQLAADGKARNARRRDTIDSLDGCASEFVPADVFERMVGAFEPPDPSRASWERNTRTLFQTNSTEELFESPQAVLQAAQTALRAITTEATRALTRQREERVSGDRKRAQTSRDQARVNTDVAHLVDLQLRQWVSSKLRDLDSASAKAQRAQLLNGRRKNFLVDLKALLALSQDTDGAKSSDADGTGSDADNGRPKRLLQLVASPTALEDSQESVRGLVDALVTFFHAEYISCELS